jgi:hypothetical protein
LAHGNSLLNVRRWVFKNVRIKEYPNHEQVMEKK